MADQQPQRFAVARDRPHENAVEISDQRGEHARGHAQHQVMVIARERNQERLSPRFQHRLARTEHHLATALAYEMAAFQAHIEEQVVAVDERRRAAEVHACAHALAYVKPRQGAQCEVGMLAAPRHPLDIDLENRAPDDLAPSFNPVPAWEILGRKPKRRWFVERRRRRDGWSTDLLPLPRHAVLAGRSARYRHRNAWAF